MPPPPEELGAAAATDPKPLAQEPSGAEDRPMRDVVQLLTGLMEGQAQRRGPNDVNRQDRLRVRDFLACNPLEFHGSRTAEDPQEFIRQMQRTLQIIRASETESVELASYRLHDVASNWNESWDLSRGEGAPPTEWDEFVEAFISHFLPPEMRRSRVDRFLQLKQNARHGCCPVQAYSQGIEERRRRRQPDKGFDRSQPTRASCQGHIARECPFKSTPGGMAQPTGSVAGSSFSVAMRRWGKECRYQQAAVEAVVELPVMAVLLIGAQCFLKIDLRSGYHQVWVREADIPKTAFRTRRQSHIIRKCPFGGGPGGAVQPTGSVAGSSSLVAMRPIW
ncbi:uncharacterized protein LOC129872411 [Solanum dulcamara]|uniref:uncharacterized protein LOC129872411 n=1 Tax=Solanum dulcamara TaxID=45834 RepID=UPI0024860D7F|nr:uncharacterized protein LOC129872411 [Solanum dulcamara]